MTPIAPKINLLILLLISLVILSCRTGSHEEIALLNYVPDDAVAVVRINDLNTLKLQLRENAFLHDFRKSGIYNDLNSHLKALRYVNHDAESVLSFVVDEKVDFLYSTRSSPNLLDTLEVKPEELEKRIIDNGDFRTLELEDLTLYLAEHGSNTLICSSSELLLQRMEAAADHEVPSTLAALYKAAGTGKTASVFVKGSQAQRLLDQTLKSPRGVSLERLSEWLALDIESNGRQLSLTGPTLMRDSLSLLNLFSGIRPLENKTPFLAPIEADAILSFTFEAHNKFTENQMNFLPQPTALDTLFNTVEEVGFFYLRKKKGILLSTYGTENINLFLEQIRAGTTEYLGNEIVSLSQTEFLSVHFQPLIKNFSANHYTLIENAFVFAEDKDVLQTVIRNYNRGNTFHKTQAYKAVSSSLANASNVLFITKNRGADDLLEADFETNVVKDMRIRSLNDYAYAASLVSDASFFHSHLLVQKLSEIEDPRSTFPMYSVGLDAKLATEPQFVKNHNTRKQEIVVQDEDNVLYLIGTDGTVLWKKQLNAQIQGRIQQVDLYRNGRLQLAFTTHDEFLIIDRNGEIVKPFEKAFAGGNLNPLAVFDYEENKNYRFVVTQGSKIYMYNSRGDIVSGFTYTEAEDTILGAPKHFRIGQKDYLVFKLADGSLKILNRIGKIRVDVREKMDFSDNEVYLYRNKFIVSDKGGDIYAVDTQAKVNKNNLNLNEYHGFDATTKSLVTLNDNVINIKGKSVTLELGVYTKPKIFYIYDIIYVSTTDIQNQKTYLFYSNGKPVADFPVLGNGVADLADIDNDRKLELVTKDQNNSLVVYKLN